MPKLRSQTSQSRVGSEPYPSLIVLQHKEHKVIVKLPTTQPDSFYRHLQKEAIKVLDVGRNSSDITLWTTESSASPFILEPQVRTPGATVSTKIPNRGMLTPGYLDVLGDMSERKR
ncbi:hypothetical protein DFP72DRAFT_1179100 [Ephemerocybe angulata]|uniref:Uncharacterized protein n=1 Tax=Ephemerocybe angulata TaxID=980116 RepID=A0A8H6HB92_9AGAR|nr:hypothetical protein DFP72DRAFT_1179100 [Tulosesus angulatus]